MAQSIIELACEKWPTKLDRLRGGFYTIKMKDGSTGEFRMNAQQEEFLLARHGMDIVLKARQLGFTTVIQLDMLDDCIFTQNISCGVIAHNLSDAKAFFSDKIKFAYDQLPPDFHEELAAEFEAEKFTEQDAADSMKFSNGSSLRVGTSLRSGTLQRLHVSEYGKLCAKYPDKAKEVKSGAFNTVQAGQSITVESTAEGQSGEFFDMCKRAQAHEQQGLPLTALDFKFHFSPWWASKEYRLDDAITIPTEYSEYFAKLEGKGIILDGAQKAWYVKKADQQGEEMTREFPSTPEEAFKASVEGAYFSTQMRKMREEGRICRIPILDQGVYTTWDLGVNDMTSITFWQDVGLEKRVIDYYENSGEGWGHYADVLRRRGYSYIEHFLPHDAQQRMMNQQATSKRQEAEKAGITPIRVVPKIALEIDGINASRSFFPNVYIDEERAARLIACLDGHRKEWDEEHAIFKNKAVHGWESHGYKSFETAAVAVRPQKKKPASVSIPSTVTAFSR